MVPLKSHSNPWGKLSNKHPHISRSSQNYSQALKGFGQVMASDGLGTITACKVTASSVMLSVGPIKALLTPSVLCSTPMLGRAGEQPKCKAQVTEASSCQGHTHSPAHISSVGWTGDSCLGPKQQQGLCKHRGMQTSPFKMSKRKGSTAPNGVCDTELNKNSNHQNQRENKASAVL